MLILLLRLIGLKLLLLVRTRIANINRDSKVINRMNSINNSINGTTITLTITLTTMLIL